MDKMDDLNLDSLTIETLKEYALKYLIHNKKCAEASRKYHAKKRKEAVEKLGEEEYKKLHPVGRPKGLPNIANRVPKISDNPV
jgi:hypothetical protein